jgi:hypothetical protein
MSLWQRILNFGKKYQVWILLVLGLIVGLAFVFSVPPWMHYDEPGHFEYAWLIANRPGMPERDDFDQDMRRQISASALEVDIEGYTGMVTDPLEINQPINIWLPQVEDHPPTYYFIAGLPLRLVPHSDIVFQLYLVRLVSLALFLVLVWVGYRTTRELFEAGHPLTWMVPLFLVTLPSFVDIMTAANNDVAAALAFSLFVWAGVALIKRGISILRVLALVGAVIACLFTKSTALMAVPLAPLVILLALFRGKKYEKIAWLVVLVCLVVGGALLISWTERAPAFFYGLDVATNPSRVVTSTAMVGDAVIQQNGRFYHHLTEKDRAEMEFQTVTFGAWVWADAPTTIRPPGIREGWVSFPAMATSPAPTRERVRFPGVRDRNVIEPTQFSFAADPIEVTTEPQFFTFSQEMPPLGGDISWIFFEPAWDADVNVYWDGIVLVVGDFTASGTPIFDDANARSGTWGGLRFSNLVRNGAAQAGWPVFSAWISDFADLPNRLVPPISLALSVLDIPATSQYYFNAVARVFRTFWSVFGWANVALYGQKPYRVFFFLTILYSLGILIGLIRRKLNISAQVLFFLSIAVVLQIMITLLRGVGSWFWLTYIPVGRYIYPAILPVGLLLMSGADQLIRWVSKLTRIPRAFLYGAFVAVQVGIFLWAFFSMRYFYFRL